MRTASTKLPRTLALFLALLLLAAILPLAGARAAVSTVPMQYGFDFQSALSKATENGTNPAYSDIDHLYLTGNGVFTKEDGEYLRATLPNLTALDLTGYSGTFEAEAFAENVNLRSVTLREGARLSRRMFFACTSLEEVVWPSRYTLADECFSYCALDFSMGYPSLLGDHNVDTFAAHQRPIVYFSLPGGESGTIHAGEEAPYPASMTTRSGTDYRALVEQAPAWLVTLPSDLALSQSVLLNGERVSELDTSVAGVYTIIYSLPATTPADNATLTYTLTVLTADGALPMELTGLPAQVRVGEAFELSCASPGAENAECWQWDESFFSAKFESPATFVPLKAGSTLIAFTGPGGETGQVEVNVLPAASVEPTPAPAEQNDIGRWLLPVGIFVIVIVAGIVIALLIRRRPLRQPLPATAGKTPATAGKAPAPPADDNTAEPPVELAVAEEPAAEVPEAKEPPPEAAEAAEEPAPDEPAEEQTPEEPVEEEAAAPAAAPPQRTGGGKRKSKKKKKGKR